MGVQSCSGGSWQMSCISELAGCSGGNNKKTNYLADLTENNGFLHRQWHSTLSGPNSHTWHPGKARQWQHTSGQGSTDQGKLMAEHSQWI
eukprot:1139640-Pelagomonas_calceolata.AAC.6